MGLIDRSKPLVAVVFRVPLFVEALAAAFEGLAEVQGVRVTDAGLGGLLDALRPDAVVVESTSAPALRPSVPTLHVDLDTARVRRLIADRWVEVDIELSGEEIRNAVLGALVSEAVL